MCVWIFRLFWTTSVPPQRRNSAKQQQHWSPPTCFQLRYTWPSLKVQSRHIKMPRFEVGSERRICDRAPCDTAERHSGPTLREQGHNLMNNKHTAKAVLQNAAVVGERRAEGFRVDGQTCCQTLLSPERNIRSNTAHKKDFFLGAVRWQFAFSSPAWRHSPAVICHSRCACVRSLFAQMGCQRSVARWITLHVKPHRRRRKKSSFRSEMLIFFLL